MVEAKLLRKKLKNGLIVDKWDLVTIIEKQEAEIVELEIGLKNVWKVVEGKQTEIEDLKNANRFIQNFAEEQHQRAVALEMRELTDEEIDNVGDAVSNLIDTYAGRREFARAILRKAQEK